MSYMRHHCLTYRMDCSILKLYYMLVHLTNKQHLCIKLLGVCQSELLGVGSSNFKAHSHCTLIRLYSIQLYIDCWSAVGPLSRAGNPQCSSKMNLHSSTAEMTARAHTRPCLRLHVQFVTGMSHPHIIDWHESSYTNSHACAWQSERLTHILAYALPTFEHYVSS